MSEIPETEANKRYADLKDLLGHLDTEQDIRAMLGEVRAKLSDLRAAVPIWEEHERFLESCLEDTLSRLGKE
jgi:hypothetical protein